jgi:rhamnosyltransferase
MAIVIVDNGSANVARAATEVGSVVARISVIENAGNLGLARALNQGIDAAGAAGANWVLLLDQDSVVIGDVVRAAAEALRSARGLKVAAIGAGRAALGAQAATSQAGARRVPAVITSGMLVSMEALRQVGPFCEDFFVDYVDIEWCLRARQAGYGILLSRTITLQHDIGNPIRRRVLGHTFTASNHSVRRRRDITCNRVMLWRRHLRGEPRYVAGDVVAFAKDGVKMLVMEERPLAKLAAVGTGLTAALRSTPRRRDDD